MGEKQSKSLSQVINYIKGLIDDNLANKYFWLKAEVSNINAHATGHYYLDLVENREGRTIAQCRATIWSSSIPTIKSELGNDFNNILKRGSEILCLVRVTFHEVFGLSIDIVQVDKFFTLGELERRKQENYERLTKEQLIGRNKLVRLPIVVQRIAVIASAGSAGLMDFVKQIEKNEYGYAFQLDYYYCQVQGEKAEREIIGRLNELNNSEHEAVVLIRGGGSKLDLEVFNSYEVTKHIALHSKPVLTGIGHETDVSLADIVANTHLKTPSAVGAFLISRNHNFDNRVRTTYTEIRKLYENHMQKQNHRVKQALLSLETSAITYTQLCRGKLHQNANRIIANTREKIARQKQVHSVANQIILNSSSLSIINKQSRLKEMAQIFRIQANQKIMSKRRELEHNSELLKIYAANVLKKEVESLSNVFDLINLYHPDKTLERGYSIARHNNKHIADPDALKVGDSIDVELLNVRLKATVTSKNLKNSKWKTLITKVLQKN